MALTPGTRIGPYEITAQIGQGGMGEVYRARDSKLKRDVAIKVLPASVVRPGRLPPKGEGCWLGRIVSYPVSTTDGFSHGQPTTLVRDVGSQAAYSSARLDHSRIIIRVNPDAAKDRGEMKLLFGWQAGLRPGTQ